MNLRMDSETRIYASSTCGEDSTTERTFKPAETRCTLLRIEDRLWEEIMEDEHFFKKSDKNTTPFRRLALVDEKNNI